MFSDSFDRSGASKLPRQNQQLDHRFGIGVKCENETVKREFPSCRVMAGPKVGTKEMEIGYVPAVFTPCSMNIRQNYNPAGSQLRNLFVSTSTGALPCQRPDIACKSGGSLQT